MTTSPTPDTETPTNQSERTVSNSTTRSLGLAAELGDQDAELNETNTETTFDRFMQELAISNHRLHEAAQQTFVDMLFGKPAGTNRYVAMRSVMQTINDIRAQRTTSQHDVVALPDAPLSVE